MVDPKEIPEEHRKHLNAKENPKRVTTSAVFSLVSDGLGKLGQRIAVIETKQDNTHAYLDDVAKKVEKLEDAVNHKIDILEDDFKTCQISGIGQRGVSEERNKWFMRAIALMITMSIASMSLIFWHLGIPFP